MRAGKSSYRLRKKRQQPFLLFLTALKARTSKREDGQLLILPSESTEEAGALSSPTPNSPTGEGGSVLVSREGLPAKTGSSSTMTEDRNTNGYSSITSPSSGKGSERN